MSRPLLISDCDEVLLHMVRHFDAWVGEAHGLAFAHDAAHFGEALRRADGSMVAADEVWPLLDGFFAREMHRQTPAPHALDALARIGAVADIVILTNLTDDHHPGRVAQLDAFGLTHRVVCNQGGKGRPVKKLLADYAPSVAVFVDDLPQHHESVAAAAPRVWRLHMVAEPLLAPHVPPAPHAHARIDDWSVAVDWVLDRLQGDAHADTLDAPPAAAE